MTNAAIRALSLAVPTKVRTNADLAQGYPDALRKMAERRVFRQATPASSTPEWDDAMRRYCDDPFQGAVKRHVVTEDETPRDLQRRAVNDCLRAADLSLERVDLMIVSSVINQQLGAGDAAYLAEAFGLRAPAINVESTCSGALVSMQLARALIETQQYERILIVVSCSYTTITDPSDPFAWWLGDAAGAMLVEAGRTAAEGIRSIQVVDTLATCNTFYCELDAADGGKPRIRMRAHRNTGVDLARTGADYLRRATSAALERAGIGIEQIDFLIVNTPVAWYADFACRILGIDRARTIDVFSYYANIGPVLPIAAAVHAAAEGLISSGNKVLFFSIGSVSTAAAAVIDWGEVAVAAPPCVPPSQVARPVAALAS
jgi:3-oxoacyl-[acyl-carrier-protein] synthase-3